MVWTPDPGGAAIMDVEQLGGPLVTARRVLLVLLALGQVVSPVLISLMGGGQQFTAESRTGAPPIVPAAYAFSIWGLVEVLCLVYGVWALVTRGPGAELRDRLASPLSVVFAGFTVWLVAAEVEPVWTTVVVFAVMLAGLLWALRIALANSAEIATWGRRQRALLWSTLGVYTGWSSAAIWINLTTAFAGSGAPITGAVGVGAQLAVLTAIAATAVALVRWTRGLLPYALTVVWALCAVVIGTVEAGEPVLATAAALALLLVVAVVLDIRWRSARAWSPWERSPA
jgi:hypothetical protein